jgi:hypothetical protein
MSRPTTRIFFSGRFLDAPQSEAAYWARLVAVRGNVVTMTATETPNLPYLGFIRCPEDRLAVEWLIDQHVKEAQS